MIIKNILIFAALSLAIPTWTNAASTRETQHGVMTLTEISTPSTPSSGYRKCYAKAAGFYCIDSAGVETLYGAAGTAPDSSKELTNLGIAASISSNTLVVALKTKAASDPSSGDPVKVGFRSDTASTGGYSQVSFTAAASITLAAADSIGHPASGSFPIWIYLIEDSTDEVCLSRAYFADDTVASASALTGGADTTSTTLWCTSAHTSRPVRRVGHIMASWSNPNWGSITKVTLMPSDSDCSHRIGYVDACTESARINCDGGSAINGQEGSWISSVGNISAGGCAVTIASGVFSDIPTCNLTFYGGGASAHSFSANPTSATNVNAYGYNNSTGSNSTGYDAHMICRGYR